MNDANRDNLDSLTRTRLGRLNSMPVDVTAARQHLRAIVAESCADEGGGARPALQGVALRRVRSAAAWGVAASVAMAIGLSVLLMNAGSTAVAGPTDLANLHRSMASGAVPVHNVSGIRQAIQVIQSQWETAPDLPTLPADHDMSCCVQQVNGKRVACLLMKDSDKPVTVVVAHAADVKTSTPAEQLRKGYTTHRFGELRMVSTIHRERFLCLMGEVDEARLIKLAESLK